MFELTSTETIPFSIKVHLDSGKSLIRLSNTPLDQLSAKHDP